MGDVEVEVEARSNAGQVGNPGTMDQELAGNATGVEAGAAEGGTVDQRHAMPALHGKAGDQGAGFARSEDDRIEVLHAAGDAAWRRAATVGEAVWSLRGILEHLLR
ncbi:MAG TPA: hypothetical protein VGQ69_06660 [Gemmatimonadales bacterium]|jgi:hypothetical protein|nr:hypothetical protein [Gemmatimonadales bacterium]